MTAPIIGRLGRAPLTDLGKSRLVVWYGNADYPAFRFIGVKGQLWRRIAEGKRRD